MPSTQRTIPPDYCQYVEGQCDKSFENPDGTDMFFAYADQPTLVSGVLEESARRLGESHGLRVRTWKGMNILGQVIFCQICKSERFTGVLVADVTTLNFNVLFEIGYALGLGVPVITTREASVCLDKREFSELGLLDTLGYVDYTDSESLTRQLALAAKNTTFPFSRDLPADRSQPLYVIKAPIPTDGQTRLLSLLKKSGLRFRTFDPRETARLSLNEAYQEVKQSLGFVGYLLADIRQGSLVHNARCALLAGMSMAQSQCTLMLQEGPKYHPIDYRDIVQDFSEPSQIHSIALPFIKRMYESLQTSRFVPITLPLKPLETVDFGDVAAENEITALKNYFVPTAQYQDVRRGHARLVVGRKGAGKTATFYGIRNAYWNSNDRLVLDLKPEGHQFTKFREAIIGPLSQGMREHVLTAFWHYLLLMEMANRIITVDEKYSRRHPNILRLYLEIKDLYGADPTIEEGDFSERLMALVNRITEEVDEPASIKTGKDITDLIYQRDIRNLHEKLSEYMRAKEGVWILIDNLDKGWPINAASTEDILFLRSFLEATRKLQRSFARSDIEMRVVVFIRNDIYDLLLKDTADKGKDTAVLLEWVDEESMQELVRRRIVASTGIDEAFEVLWPTFFEMHVAGESSFSYLTRRALMRPRELLRLLKLCVNAAINRGHEKVLEGDIIQAEKIYSEDQLQEVSFDLKDVSPEYCDVVYAFIGAPVTLNHELVKERLLSVGVKENSVEHVLSQLLWFAFLGVVSSAGEERYSYEYQYGVTRMLRETRSERRFVLHPAFRVALGTQVV